MQILYQTMGEENNSDQNVIILNRHIKINKTKRKEVRNYVLKINNKVD